MFVRTILSRHGTCRLRCIGEPCTGEPSAPAQQAGKAMQSFAQACEDWDEWDKPAEPFLITATPGTLAPAASVRS